MSTNGSPRHITRIREEFRPTAPVQTALDAFLEKPSGDHWFYTQAERVVLTEEYRDVNYQGYVRTAERRLRQFGRRTIALAPDVRIRADTHRLTLLFDIADSDRATFVEMASALDEIEWEGTTHSGLYVQLARSSLANSARLHEAASQMSEELRNSSAERQMRIGDPRIVSRDIIVESLT